MIAPVITLERRGKKGVWWIRYSFKGERYHYSLGTTDEAEALKIKERIRYEIINGIHKPQKKMIFDNLLKSYLDLVKKLNAESSYMRDVVSAKYLSKFFRSRRIDQLTLQDGEEYRNKRHDGLLLVEGVSRKEKYSNISINRELRLLITMFNKAVAWGLLDKNPFQHLKLFKEMFRERYVTTEEWPRLISVCSSTLRNLVFFARFTGMRLSEILNCKLRDIEWTLNHISVTKCKNNTPRIIPMNPKLRTILENIRKNSTSEYVFPGKNDDRESEIKHAFRAACKKAGIKNLRFHDLRHTFASDMINAGVDLPTLMKLMGHKTIQTTMRYAHLYPRHIEEAIRKTYDFYEKIGPNVAQNDDEK